jgi:hypothetical protein
MPSINIAETSVEVSGTAATVSVPIAIHIAIEEGRAVA